MGASMRIIFSEVVGGQTVIRNMSVAAGVDAAASFVKSKPGIGKQFWAFDDADMPAGTITSVDFNDAPVVSASTAANKTAINAIEVEPEDVLFF